MSMQKVTTTRKSSNCVDAGKVYWDYYRSLDREIKEEFIFEVMNATGWGKSTFYTRMKNGTGWTKAEVPLVQSIYEKYKKMYPYEQANLC